MIGAFKSLTTNQYAFGVREREWPPFNGRLWQRNFYEHIIRNEREMDAIRRYIIDNPLKWAIDRDNPQNAV
jgi:REP element-mobilizing transposase RayT